MSSTSTAPMQLPPAKELLAMEEQLCEAPHDLKLHRQDPEGRAALGVTSTRWQMQRSLACLEFLRGVPEVLGHFEEAQPERWEQMVGLRLYGAQCRRALAPLRSGAWRANLLLLGQITEENDRIEDALLGQAGGKETSAEDRRRLASKFDDPASLRRLFEETSTDRRKRRGRRAAIQATAAAQAHEVLQRENAIEEIRRGPVS